MGTCDLPDMYTLSPQASVRTPSALRPQGVHIRQTTCTHVTYAKYTVQL